MTLVLLVAAGLVMKSFLKLQRAHLCFEPGGLLSFQSRLPANQFFVPASRVLRLDPREALSHE